MDGPARAVSGLTLSAKALYVAGAAHAMPHGAVLYLMPSDGDLEETCADVSFVAASARYTSASDNVAAPTVMDPTFRKFRRDVYGKLSGME